ncbi:hypothetical protein [Planktotalea sp.]|uniref:hypothetical protein n=1 Tax=Planktotalea sp. TaxID=2029877 RepID=UPI0035C7F70D
MGFELRDPSDLNALAEDYVSLALHLHNHDPNPYIFIGDKALQAAIKADKRALRDLDVAFMRLREALAAISTLGCEQTANRRALLVDRADALLARSAILQGKMPTSFDAEVEALYSVQAPEQSEDHFRALAVELEHIIPENGPLQERMSRYRDRFLLPPEHVEQTVAGALEEAQRRTRAKMDLPEDEDITLLMNNVGSFGAFAEYLGKGKTNVHFSTTMPFHVDRAVELATHEAYPGHHVQATLLEAEMIDRRGWQEFTMLPLFGAHTIVAEGAANYGVSLSFTREERITYDRDIVLPQAGLTHLASEIADYHRYVDYVERLNYARNEAARRLLYQGWTRERAVEWLMEFGLETRAIAEMRLTIIETIRSYVITYNYGLDWVRDRIERNDTPNTTQKWTRLRGLFEAPVMPVKSHLGMVQRWP